jgi:superfamily II DNA or RNA helicase
MLRKHQQELDDLCKEILAGSPSTRIIIGVTPGGGKSLLPVIAAHRLIPDIADAVCWVVPRQSLQRQAEETFLAPAVRSLIGHARTIRASSNEVDPCRGHSGYVTTYQAIHADPHLHMHEFLRKRYLLFLDELHHVEALGEWHHSLQPLVDHAALVVVMSGTWERNDQHPIGFLPYRSIDNGLITPDLSPTDDTKIIRYSRTDALREQAIKPLRLYSLDGQAEWLDRQGERCQIASLSAAGNDLSDALLTALRTEYAHHLLERCVADWQAAQEVRPRSKLLVVAATIHQAQDYLAHLQTLGCSRAAIATSDDSQAAQHAIQRFKRPPTDRQHLDALVTVAMAYEGLDVPAITHIACLTHIRSKPWIEQMAARAARVDKGIPYHEQVGHIYGPDDDLLHACFAAIRAEQEPFLKERIETEDPDGPAGTGTDVDRLPSPGILPLTSSATRERAMDLTDGTQAEYEELAHIRTALERHGLHGLVDPIQALELVRDLHPRSSDPPATEDDPAHLLTPSERERTMRQQIEQAIRRIEAQSGIEHGTINQSIVREFGKSRRHMTESELQIIWQWLQGTYRRFFHA